MWPYLFKLTLDTNKILYETAFIVMVGKVIYVNNFEQAVIFLRMLKTSLC
jgi:hypothetical protein